MGKNKTITKVFKSPEIEKLADDTLESAKKQLSGFGEGFLNQLLGSDSNQYDASKKSPNEIFIKDPVNGEINIFHAADHKNKTDVKKPSAEKISKPEILPGIDYRGAILKNSERASEREKEEMKKRLQEILDELQRLISSSKVLKTEFAEVSMQQTPSQAGDYHLNFFDWVILTIRTARQKVEDSGAWLKAVKSKKNKVGYWNMFKKHGTTFGLSNERVVATQTG